MGHPLLDIPAQQWDEPLPVPPEAELVGLLPGSRMSEISRLALCCWRRPAVCNKSGRACIS